MKSFAPTPATSSLNSGLEFSTFIITINTNQVFSDMDTPTKNKMEKFFMSLVGVNNTKRFVDTFVIMGVPGTDDKIPIDNRIVEYSLTSHMELSSTDLLHNHTALKVVAHKVPGYSLLIDIDRIRSLFYRVFGYRAYVNVRKSHDNESAMRYYSSKGTK